MRYVVALLALLTFPSCLAVGAAAVVAGAERPNNSPSPEMLAAADIGEQPDQANCEAVIRAMPIDVAAVGNLERGWYRVDQGLMGLRFAWSASVTVRLRNADDELVLSSFRYFFLDSKVVARTRTNARTQRALDEWNGGGRNAMQAGLAPSAPKDGSPWKDAEGWLHTGNR